MSGEIYNPQTMLERLHGIDADIRTFVAHVAEVDTVFDYRNGGRRLLQQRLRERYNELPFAGEAVTITSDGEDGSMVYADHQKNRLVNAADVETGYFEGFFLQAQPVSTPEVNTVEDLLSAGVPSARAGWNDPTALLEFSIGMRLKPMHVPDGMDPDMTKIEVILTTIGDIKYAQDFHPLLPEVEIFDFETRSIIDNAVDIGLSSREIEQAVSDCAQQQAQESGRLGSVFEMDLHRDATVFLAKDLAAARAYLFNFDEHQQDFPAEETLQAGFSRHMQLMGYDWLPEDFDPGEGSRYQPTLFGVFKLLDSRDVDAAAGCDVVAIPVDDVRFGTLVESQEQAEERFSSIFAYENQLFGALLTAMAADRVTYDSYSAVESELARFRSVVGKTYQHIEGADVTMRPSWSRVLDAKVLLSVGVDQTVEGSYSFNGDIVNTEVNLYRRQIVLGRVIDFIITLGVQGDQLESSLGVRVDVTRDRYCSARGINVLDLPVDLILSSQVLTDPGFGFERIGKRFVPRQSGYPDAN